jgi:DNA-binding transcriptional MocR family regulator
MTPDRDSAGLLANALRASVQMPAFLMVAVVTRWLQDGSADAMISAIRDEAAARQKLAAEVLARHAFSRHPNGHHIWIPLPRSWSRAEFASHGSKARARHRCRRNIQRRGKPVSRDSGFPRRREQPLRMLAWVLWGHVS